MSQVCSKCSHVNPADASYCYYDGAVLGGHGVNGGPVNAGSAPFPSPFVFPNGQQCRNFDQLATACQQHWSSAVDLLKQGFLASFLGGLGRVDLAMAAQEAARFPDQDRALDQLLDKLPTDVLKKPKLLAEPTEINLGTIPVGSDRQFELHLHNQGMRLLYGSAVSDCKWLTLGDAPGNAQKLFQFGSEGTVLVQVRGQHLRAGNKPLEGHLVLESNGGSPVTITVRADVPARPFRDGVLAGAISPRQIAEKAKAHPKDAAPLFERGTVAAWFKENGWTYPVQGPSASGLGAVQQFFEALGLATAPKVDVTEKSLSLSGDIGTAVQATLEVKTQEKRPVYAHATTDQDWLDVSKTILSGRVATIVVSVPNVPNRPGEVLQAKINVTANGNQRFAIPLTLQVTGRSPYPLQPVILPVQPARGSSPGFAVPIVQAVQAIPVVQPVPVVQPMQVVQPMPVAQATYPTVEPVPVMAVPMEPQGNPFAALTEPVMAVTATAAAVAAAPMVAAPAFQAPAVPRRPGAEGKTSIWVHLAPAGVLLLALIIVIIRDLLHGGGAPTGGDVDPNPRTKLYFGNGGVDADGKDIGTRMTVGVVARDPADPKGPWKRLTYDQYGRTNTTLVKIDGNTIVYGLSVGGGWSKDPQGKSLRDVKMPSKWNPKVVGMKSVWVSDNNVEITQTVETIPGEPNESEDFRRLLDTTLVRYTIVNRDTKKHRVGLRFLLDTLIGKNDGVPFTVPGLPGLVDKFHDFDGGAGGKVPDFVQVLENPNLQNPGVVAFLNPKVGGGLGAPDRLSLTRWNATVLQVWDVPITSFAGGGKLDGDSAIVLYWNEQEMPPGAKREIGFTYGLGSVSAASGRLGMTVGGDYTPGGELTVVALVSDPGKDKSVTLKVPAGFTIVEGKDTQEAPPLGPGGRPAPITWRVRSSPQVGTYNLELRTSGDISQKKRVKIKTEAIF